MQINKTTYYWLVAAIILFAALSRIVPHPPNFTPIGAIGLFAGSFLMIRKYWVVPIIALLISDFIIGLHHPVVMFCVYFSFLLSALFGRYVLHSKVTLFRVTGGALFSATQFFIITNLGVWIAGELYPYTLNGLIECYLMAIPFYGNTLVGDLFYCAILFGSNAFLMQLYNESNKSSSSQVSQ